MAGAKQRVEQQREGALEADFQCAVVGRAPAVHHGGEDLPEGIALRPPFEARGAILRADRFAVMEAQPLAQPDGPTITMNSFSSISR